MMRLSMMHVSLTVLHVCMMRLKFCHQPTNERTNEQGDSRSRIFRPGRLLTIKCGNSRQICSSASSILFAMQAIALALWVLCRLVFTTFVTPVMQCCCSPGACVTCVLLAAFCLAMAWMFCHVLYGLLLFWCFWSKQQWFKTEIFRTILFGGKKSNFHFPHIPSVWPNICFQFRSGLFKNLYNKPFCLKGEI